MSRPSRWLRVTVATIVLLLSVNGCQVPTPPNPASLVTYTSPTTGPALTPTSNDPRIPPSPAFVAALGWPTPVSPTDLDQAVGLESVAWAYVSDDSTAPSLTVVAGDGGGCNSPAGLVLRDTPDGVTLLVLSRHVQPPGTACNGELVMHSYLVALSAPLGARSLLHGPTGDGLPLVVPMST